MFRKPRKLGVETMEARELNAGDVTAFMMNGNLNLAEAAGQIGADNSVLISQLPDGRIRVKGNGILADNSVSKVNGAAFQDFTVPGSLSVRFGGGNDLVILSELAPPSFDNVTIDVAAPPAVLGRAFLKLPSVMPTDRDVVLFTANTRGSVKINTGEGNDWVFVSDSNIGDAYDNSQNLLINTGAGADTVQVESNHGVMQIQGSVEIVTYASVLETDADLVWVERVQVLNDIRVRTGGGADQIFMYGSFVNHLLDFDAGAGNDQMTLENLTVVDRLMAQLGGGDDSLTTKGLGTDFLTLAGGGGNDSLTKSADEHIGQRQESGWEWINERPVLGGVFTGTVLTKQSRL